MANLAKIFTVIATALVLVACNKSQEQTKSLEGSSSTSTATTSLPVAAKPVITPLKTYDGPLGLAMGIPVDILVKQFHFEEPTSESPNVYAGSPPKPAPGFDSYVAIATAGQGVCKIGAIANVNLVNDTGYQIKSETDRIAEMVELKYGKPSKKYDFATQDVYRKNPQFFMMALREDAVTYAYSWTNKSGDTILPNDLAEIEVMAAASETNQGWVRLLYTFNNNTACNAEIKKQKAANL